MAAWLSLEEWRQRVLAGEPVTPETGVRLLSASAVRAVQGGSSGGRKTIDFRLSTQAVDRERDVIRVDGWDLTNFRRNPVVLWAHQFLTPPIGRAVRVWREQDGLFGRTEFLSADVNPFAGAVAEMYARGFLHAVSVSLRPIQWAYNQERQGFDFLTQELLEYSAVPVPANPEALIAQRGLSDAPVVWRDVAAALVAGDADRLARLLPVALRKGPSPTEVGPAVVTRGVSPRDVSMETAPEDTPWSAPTLSDFTDGSWDELTEPEQRRIAGHFAWAASMPPATFGDLKLPHHRASDGAVVWRGVAAAAQRLEQADIPEADLAAVRAHLARHYRQFDREPPWERGGRIYLDLALACAEAEAG
jgi:HK97 family phage prohead protease